MCETEQNFIDALREINAEFDRQAEKRTREMNRTTFWTCLAFLLSALIFLAGAILNYLAGTKQ